MRPEILFPLFAPVTSLKGVGPRVATLLERLAGPIVRDVLFLTPHSLVRRTPAQLSAAADGEVMTFEVLLDQPDQDLYAWIVGTAETPVDFDHEIMNRIKAFRDIVHSGGVRGG